MKAVQVTRYGGPDVLEVAELPDPTPGAGEVIIRTRAIGVNFTDIFARMGLSTSPLPFVPGLEVAGVIEAVGSDVSTTLQPGLPAIGFTPFTLGGYSERVVVPAHYSYLLPDGIPFKDACCFTLNYLTAYAALYFMAQVRREDRVLIQAAAGGVGLAAVQLARLVDAEIFATASASKHDFLRAQGVAHPIDYHTVDFEKEIRRITGDTGVDVALDSIGGESIKKSLRVLRFGGRLVTYGASYLADNREELGVDVEERITSDTLDLYPLQEKSVGIMGAQLGGPPELLATWMQTIFALYLDRRIRPHISRTFSLAEAAQAHRYLHDRENTGKVLLIP